MTEPLSEDELAGLKARVEKLTPAEHKFFSQKGAPVPDSIWQGNNSDFLRHNGFGWHLSPLGLAVASALKDAAK